MDATQKCGYDKQPRKEVARQIMCSETLVSASDVGDCCHVMNVKIESVSVPKDIATKCAINSISIP